MEVITAYRYLLGCNDATFLTGIRGVIHALAPSSVKAIRGRSILRKSRDEGSGREPAHTCS